MPPRSLQPVSLVGLSFLAASLSFAANQIAPHRIQIDSPLTDTEVSSIQALKRWPNIAVNLAQTATDASFASLEKLPEIREITFAPGNGNITGLKPVASLPHLKTLKLNSVKKAASAPFSLAPLARCPELVEIEFYSTPITDVDALAACTKLQNASFYMSAITSLEFLAATPEMQKLNLYGTEHTFPSYEPVARLTKLRELNIYMNKQATDSNLSVLQKLTSLRIIHMAKSSQVSSLDFLSNCIELETLQANWCRKLTDIKALARMPKLNLVYLSDAAITDIAPLSDKPKLEFLNLSGVKITDFSSLKNFRSLRQLDLSKTTIQDLSLFADMPLLETLNVGKTSVSDLKPLKDLPKLMHLTFDKSAVTDLSPLAGLATLRSLSFEKTGVTDLSPIHGLVHLDSITVSRTIPQTQIEALRAALPKLEIRFE